MGVVLRSAIPTCRGYRTLNLDTRAAAAANISAVKSSHRTGAVVS
jgi:hypothetical protein